MKKITIFTVVLLLTLGFCSKAQIEWALLPKNFDDQKIMTANNHLIYYSYDEKADQTTLYQSIKNTNNWDSIKLDGLVNISRNILWKTDNELFEYYYPEWPISKKISDEFCN